jgi:hypothetical protein
MKSTVFAADEAGKDAEEGVALVPPPATQENGGKGATTPCEKEDAAAAPVAQARRRWSLKNIMRTRGVGSVMIGMVVLALLIGAQWWIDMDAVRNN